MQDARKIFDEVLIEILPDTKYTKEIFSKVDSIINKINLSRSDIKAILGGSGSKGTWLRNFDADIFVLFDYKKYKEKSNEISQILEKILIAKFKKITRIHGSRDYFQIKEKNFTFEIVPILNIKRAEQARNITDVSPLHSKWVLKCKKLVNEMRLAKQFCLANNIYGAESHIKGISGYVCEILIVYYGSFLNLLRNATKWKEKQVIDVAKSYKGKDIFRILNSSKLESPLIVIDPVQKDRNAAAALSIEKFHDFRNAARLFLKNPSRDFFKKKSFEDKISRKKGRLICIEALPKIGKIDVIGSKLLKVFEFLKTKIEDYGFSLLDSDWEWEKNKEARFYFLFKDSKLDKKEFLQGPPLRLKEHAENFRKMHKRTYVNKGKIFAIEQRKFLEPQHYMKSLLKENYVKDRVKSIRIV